MNIFAFQVDIRVNKKETRKFGGRGGIKVDFSTLIATGKFWRASLNFRR